MFQKHANYFSKSENTKNIKLMFFLSKSIVCLNNSAEFSQLMKAYGKRFRDNMTFV